jgi:hypothetical protein
VSQIEGTPAVFVQSSDVDVLLLQHGPKAPLLDARSDPINASFTCSLQLSGLSFASMAWNRSLSTLDAA